MWFKYRDSIYFSGHPVPEIIFYPLGVDFSCIIGFNIHTIDLIALLVKSIKAC